MSLGSSEYDSALPIYELLLMEILSSNASNSSDEVPWFSMSVSAISTVEHSGYHEVLPLTSGHPHGDSKLLCVSCD